MGSHYYGKRGAVWIRLKHVESGRNMLFVNHHGPLEVNSGGQCGGESIANNLAILMQQRAQPGDILILVGDFNSNAASLTVTNMWTCMVLLHSGDSFGGVDNIFGNMDTGSLVFHETLGDGGSDHHAIAAEVQIGGARRLSKGALPPPAASLSASALTKAPPGDDWQHFWCGRLEDQTEYVVPEGGWSLVETKDVGAPQRCCRACQRHKECKSWVWVMWAGNGPLCKLSSLLPTKKVPNDQLVSGLSATTAAVLAAEEAKKTAISSLEPGYTVTVAVEDSSDAVPQPEAAAPEPEAASSSSCQDAKPGDTCFVEIQWARADGIGAHPEWYPGLTPSSSVADFQKIVHANAPSKCPAPCAAEPVPTTSAEPIATTSAEPAAASSPAANESTPSPTENQTATENETATSSCHDAQPGDDCYAQLQWARSDGIYAHPEWYPGLTASSSIPEFQKVVSGSGDSKCLPPCA